MIPEPLATAEDTPSADAEKRQRMKEYVERWRNLGPILEAPREEDVRQPFIDALLERYAPRRPDARQFALMNRVLLLQNKVGIGIDIAMGALGFEASATQRAIPVEVYPNIFLRLCSPEDLIVMKAFASRPQDGNDVRMTIVRKGVDKRDWPYINQHLKELAELKEAPEILTQLEALRTRCAA